MARDMVYIAQKIGELLVAEYDIEFIQQGTTIFGKPAIPEIESAAMILREEAIIVSGSINYKTGEFDLTFEEDHRTPLQRFAEEVWKDDPIIPGLRVVPADVEASDHPDRTASEDHRHPAAP